MALDCCVCTKRACSLNRLCTRLSSSVFPKKAENTRAVSVASESFQSACAVKICLPTAETKATTLFTFRYLMAGFFLSPMQLGRRHAKRIQITRHAVSMSRSNAPWSRVCLLRRGEKGRCKPFMSCCT